MANGNLPGHLCWTCASAQGYLVNMAPEAALSSSYQLEKFVKHTTPTWAVGVNSVFADPSVEAYGRYVITSVASGSVALDYHGRPTFIWYAGETIGATYENGVYKMPNDAIKVVLPYDQQKVHGYSVSSVGYNVLPCASCGAPILG